MREGVRDETPLIDREKVLRVSSQEEEERDTEEEDIKKERSCLYYERDGVFGLLRDTLLLLFFLFLLDHHF